MPKINKTEAEWREQLSDEQFYVLRQEGTERAFTSPLNKEYRDGMFNCAGCGKPLCEYRYSLICCTRPQGWSFRKLGPTAARHDATILGQTFTQPLVKRPAREQ